MPTLAMQLVIMTVRILARMTDGASLLRLGAGLVDGKA